MKNTNRLAILIAFIIVISGIMRISHPGFSEYKADEARLYTESLNFVRSSIIPTQGINSSIGIPNFAISTWIYSIPLIFWQHPYSAIIYTGLLNTLSILMCWYITKKCWGTKSAIVATTMYALSPWAIIFSRKIWAQNLLPFFVGAWAISILQSNLTKSSKANFFHGLLIGILPQIHFSGIALIPVSLLNTYSNRKQFKWKPFATGFGISLLLASSIFLNVDILDLIKHIPTSSQSLTATASPITLAWMLSTGSNIHSLLGQDIYLDYISLNPYIGVLHWTWTLLIIYGSITIITKHSSSNPRSFEIFILSWMYIPIIIHYISPFDVHIHYFILTFPSQYILASIAFANIVDSINKVLAKLSWTIILSNFCAQILAILILYQFISTNYTNGGYGTPLSLHLNPSEKLRQMYKHKTIKEVIIADTGDNPYTNEFAAIYQSLIHDIPHRFIDIRHNVLLPNHAIAVIYSSNNISTQSNIYTKHASMQHTYKLRPKENTIIITTLNNSTKIPIEYISFPGPNQLVNGATILGYSIIEKTSQPITWSVIWKPGLPDTQTYHMFTHLLDDKQNKIGQSDKPLIDAKQWDPNDTIITFFDEQLPFSKPYTIMVGMYTYPSIKNITLLNKQDDHRISAYWIH